MIELRPYQESAIDQVLDYAIEHPRGRLLVVLAPRSGKTATIATAAQLMTLEQGLRCLWIVGSKEILDATRAQLVACGVPDGAIGVLYQNYQALPDRPFQIASEATLDRRNKPEAQLVVWDEAHHDQAPRRRRIRALYPEAFHLGMTGTPHTLNGAGLDADYDRMLTPVQPSELIHDGYLSVPTIYAPEDHYLPKMRGIKHCAGDFAAPELERLVSHDAAIDKLVEEWERLAEGRATVVYPVTVAHSERLTAAFVKRGHVARHLGGDTSAAERAETVAALRAGSLPVVCSVGVLSEGVDLPEVKCCILARPTMSLALHIQQGARCMTPWRGIRPRILDVVGNSYRHGFAYEDRAWSLQRRAPGKPSAGHERAKRCNCGAVATIGARTCAACGASFASSAPPPPPVEARALSEVRWTPAQVAEKRKQLEAFAADRAAQGRPVAEGWTVRVLAAMVNGEGAPVVPHDGAAA